jgi:hypothetical protein
MRSGGGSRWCHESRADEMQLNPTVAYWFLPIFLTGANPRVSGHRLRFGIADHAVTLQRARRGDRERNKRCQRCLANVACIAYVMESDYRSSSYRLGATRSMEVVDADQRPMTVTWGRCRSVRLLHLLLHPA